VDEDDFDPEAGGELPQPARTRAITTSAAPNQVLPGLMSVLLMLRDLHVFRSWGRREAVAVGEHEDAAGCRLLPLRSSAHPPGAALLTVS
jgi:hypothetical protein